MPHVPGHGPGGAGPGPAYGEPEAEPAAPINNGNTGNPAWNYMEPGGPGMGGVTLATAPAAQIYTSGLPFTQQEFFRGDPRNMELSSFGGDPNMRDLFGRLNLISMRNKSGGGSGGGSQEVEGNMDANMLIALNPYLQENVTSFKKGGTLTPKEMKKVQSLGRNGDTMLAHINPQEAAILKAMGGSGTINPYTGLREYGWLSNFLGSVLDPVSDVLGGVGDVVSTVTDPVFDAVGNVVDPLAQGASDVVSGAGDLISSGIDTAVDTGIDVLKTGTETASDIFSAVASPIGDLISEPMDFMSDFVFGIPDALGDLLGGGRDDFNPYQAPAPKKIKREAVEKQPEMQMSNLQMINKGGLAGIEKSSDPSGLRQGDWVGSKENVFVTPNVEEELDYAAKGMKMSNYGHGGHFTQKANQAIAMNQLSGLVANAMNKRNMMMAKGGSFKPHMMYDPKTGKGYKAEKLQDHLDMKEKGYDHRKRNPENYPKAAYGMKMKKRYTNGGRF